MGLFTNICVNAGCEHRVRKGSQFCPKCGGAAPKGLSVCGACGSEVAQTSKFCWKCGCELADMAKPLVLNDRWSRRPGDFAVRIDKQDIKGWLAKPLIIEHGTRALLFQNGLCKGELGEGSYDTGGFLKRLVHFNLDMHACVVLVEAGDVVIDLENGQLWTADKMELASTERLVLRIADPDAMFVNIFKGSNRVGLDELECQLAGEVQMLLAGIVGEFAAEDLFTGDDARNEVETQLRYTMATTLGRLGLELVQLRFVSFSGEAYEALRRKWGRVRAEEGKVDIVDARAKLRQRLRTTLTQDKMDGFKSDSELEEFIRRTEHDLGLKAVVRDDEMQRLKEGCAFERSRDAVLRRIEIEGIENDEQRARAWKDLHAEESIRDEAHAHDLKRQLAQAKTDAEKQKIQLDLDALQHARDMREAGDGLDLLERTKDIEQAELDREQQREAATLEARGKATAEALLSVVDGPAADRITALERLRARENMSPEQLLAIAAEASPEAAKALGAKYQAEGQINAERLAELQHHMAEQREMADGQADRMERVMQTALAQMGQVAATRARPIEPAGHTVVAGGLGAPVVITPPTSASAGTCSHCNAALEGDGQFCPQCGKQQ